MTKRKTQRYSISVSARTYERLRARVNGSLAGFVDSIMETALDDPATMARLVAKCRGCKEAEL